MFSKCIKTSYFQGVELQKERDSEKKKAEEKVGEKETEDKTMLAQNIIAVLSLRFMNANIL